MSLYFFLGVMLTKIIGSNLPSQVIMSSSRELVIKFKSNINNASFFIKNVEAKFLIDYETVDNGKIKFNLIFCMFE